METATDLLVTIATTSPTWDQQVELIKQYAKQVAEQALNDAADNADFYIAQNDDGLEPYHHISNIYIDRNSILNTEIITP